MTRLSTSGSRFAESAASRVVDVYQRHADAWSRDRADRLPEKAWLDSFLTLLPDEPVVLDVGCGTGVPIARYLVERCCQVTGVDGSRAMIARCAGQFLEHKWHVGDMRTLALNHKFDRIVAWDSVFHLSPIDQR
jgi:trans-aconitate methyltransferase